MLSLNGSPYTRNDPRVATHQWYPWSILYPYQSIWQGELHYYPWTHWGHICIRKLSTIGWSDCLSLFNDNPLFEPVVVCCQLDTKEHISMKFCLKLKSFHLWIYIWKCVLQKWQPSCLGLNVLDFIQLLHNWACKAIKNFNGLTLQKYIECDELFYYGLDCDRITLDRREPGRQLICLSVVLCLWL